MFGSWKRNVLLAVVGAAGLVATLFVAGSLGGGAATASPVQASRVVDRTLSCATLTRGGIHEIEARVHPGVRESRARWAKLAFAVVSTGGTASAATVLDNSYAWITAGRPSAQTTLGDYFYPVRVRDYATLAVNRRLCRTVKTRVPLSFSGLRGGAASPLGDVYDCTAPRRVIVRVRARLIAAGRLIGHERFVATATPIREARLVVRTQGGRTLAYADVLENGNARLFTAPRCIPE